MYILNQVISNAIKYNKRGGTVSFKIINDERSTLLQIIDTGVGMPEKDLERVFELFYTGDNGRENINSTGIGLAMVKSVTKLLGHGISLKSVVEVGTTFEIKFDN